MRTKQFECETLHGSVRISVTDLGTVIEFIPDHNPSTVYIHHQLFPQTSHEGWTAEQYTLIRLTHTNDGTH
jgi:hypothetical protein